MPAVALVLFAAFAAADDPVVLEFTSRNCPACRTVEPVVRGLAAEGFPVRQVDGTAQPQLVQQYKVRGYPTFVLVAGGREAGRIEGVASRERLIGLLKPAIAATEPIAKVVVRGQSPETSRSAPSPLEATVRLHVQDLNGNGAGVGTGTIIDTHYNEESKAEEALLITCGHLFRESQGKGKIIVELFVGGQISKVEGQLLDFDDKKDIALVTIWPGVRVTPVQVAPASFVSRPQDRVFTVGCSNGQDPTVQESRVNAINRFAGKPNITVAGLPANGRSGGGLFSAEGLLIGVCNAANEEDNEGLYASLPTVHWQLDKFNLQAIYQRAEAASDVAVEPKAPALESIPVAAPARTFALASAPVQRPLPDLAREMPRSAPLVEETGLAADDDTEVVCIVRSKRNPESQSEVFVVDRVDSDLLSRITTAARQSAQARLSSRGQVQPADRIARENPAGEQPVVRGQMR